MKSILKQENMKIDNNTKCIERRMENLQMIVYKNPSIKNMEEIPKNHKSIIETATYGLETLYEQFEDVAQLQKKPTIASIIHTVTNVAAIYVQTHDQESNTSLKLLKVCHIPENIINLLKQQVGGRNSQPTPTPSSTQSLSPLQLENTSSLNLQFPSTIKQLPSPSKSSSLSLLSSPSPKQEKLQLQQQLQLQKEQQLQLQQQQLQLQQQQVQLQQQQQLQSPLKTSILTTSNESEISPSSIYRQNNNLPDNEILQEYLFLETPDDDFWVLVQPDGSVTPNDDNNNTSIDDDYVIIDSLSVQYELTNFITQLYKENPILHSANPDEVENILTKATKYLGPQNATCDIIPTDNNSNSNNTITSKLMYSYHLTHLLYSMWGWASLSFALYKHPTASKFLLRWAYKSAEYFIVFFI